jgi:small-conductance mechanosensitive channel
MIQQRFYAVGLLTPALRGAAVCAMLTAFTTAVLIGVPYLLPAADTVDASMRRAFNPLYLFRLVVGIGHPLLVLVGALGVAVLTWQRAPGRTVVGVVFFVLWTFAEAVEQALLLITMNLRWRREYLATRDPNRQAVLQAHVEGVDAITDGFFFVILVAFIVANALFAWALLGSGHRRDRLPGACFVIGTALGVISLSQTLGSDVGGAAMDLLYPLLQPAARFIVGMWLWRSASRPALA